MASALAALAAGSAVLFSASPWLALAVLTGVPVVLVASRLLARPLVGRAEREQNTLAAATAAATDLVTGLRVLKGIGAEPAAAAGYARASQVALRARLAAVTAEGGFLGVTTALTGLLLVVVGWIAGRLALAGTISIGELVAAVGLAQFLIEPLERLTRLGPLLAGARGAAGRVATFLSAPPAVTSGDNTLPEPVEGRLQIEQRALALELSAGEHLGVVIINPGTTASLLDVLGREEPDGTVRLDGTDLATVPLAAARRAVLAARHDAALFEGSLADNLLTDQSPDEPPWPRLWPPRPPTRSATRCPTAGHRDRRARAYVVRRSAAAGRPRPGPGRRAGGPGAARPDHRHRLGHRGPDRRRSGSPPRRPDHPAGHLQPGAAGPLRPGGAGHRRCASPPRARTRAGRRPGLCGRGAVVIPHPAPAATSPCCPCTRARRPRGATVAVSGAPGRDPGQPAASGVAVVVRAGPVGSTGRRRAPRAAAAAT